MGGKNSKSKSELQNAIREQPNYSKINLCQSCEEVSRQFNFKQVIWGEEVRETHYDSWYKKHDCLDKTCTRFKRN